MEDYGTLGSLLKKVTKQEDKGTVGQSGSGEVKKQNAKMSLISIKNQTTKQGKSSGVDRR